MKSIKERIAEREERKAMTREQVENTAAMDHQAEAEKDAIAKAKAAGLPTPTFQTKTGDNKGETKADRVKREAQEKADAAAEAAKEAKAEAARVKADPFASKE